MNPIPKHIAIIMDGNGRWAKAKGLPRVEGHRRGVEVVEEIVEACRNMGVRHLTLYAFSEENWRRPDEEVKALMQLLSYFIKSKCEKMISNGIRFRTIGDVLKLPEDVQVEVESVKKETSNCADMDLILALSYGSHSELARAFNKMVKEGKKEIESADIEAHLDTAGIPHPELLIRTSGEYRLSNFMLWQLAYSELYFTTLLWPEFNRKELATAIEDYRLRERRFGGISEES